MNTESRKETLRDLLTQINLVIDDLKKHKYCSASHKLTEMRHKVKERLKVHR